MSKYVIVANFTQYEDNDRTLDSKIRSIGTADSIEEAIQIAEEDLSDIVYEYADNLYGEDDEEEAEEWINNYVSNLTIDPIVDPDKAEIGDQCVILQCRAFSDHWVDIHNYSIIKIG